MRKSFIYIVIFTMILAIFGFSFNNADVVQAKYNIPEGTVFKGKGHSTLYYLASDGKRHVFPNRNTYLSWYEDFSDVVEVDDSDLSQFPLGGNVRYKPGVLLVKIQSDPKVYVVGVNGLLRWIKTEYLAKKLYGDNWNLLVDDVPVTFFINYVIGIPVEDETEFDSDDEEDGASSIDQNRKAKIKAKILKRIIKRKTKLCDRLERRLNRIQNRLERRGITVSGIGDNFIERCVEDDEDDNSTDDNTSVVGEKVTICHVPPGNPDNAKTITVGAPSARAHLSHGDTLGECEGDGGNGDETDTTPPVISNIVATPNATSTTITWTTDEDSTSAVEYASESLDTASSTTEIIDETLVTSHSIELTDLATSTQYFFIVESKDASDNTATSTEQNFITT